MRQVSVYWLLYILIYSVQLYSFSEYVYSLCCCGKNNQKELSEIISSPLAILEKRVDTLELRSTNIENTIESGIAFMDEKTSNMTSQYEKTRNKYIQARGQQKKQDLVMKKLMRRVNLQTQVINFLLEEIKITRNNKKYKEIEHRMQGQVNTSIV